MKFRVLYFTAFVILASCSASRKAAKSSTATDVVTASLDLINVTNDKVLVTVSPSYVNEKTIAYQLPKIIPGTYAISNYGRYVEDFKAYDKSGKELVVARKDTNTWVINNASQLGKITYFVNDTYDTESEGGAVFTENSTTIFSPAGTNILAGKQFMLNLCGFVGYFTGYQDKPHKLQILHPANLYGATALTDADNNDSVDVFNIGRYADVVDNPVMYSIADTATFNVDGMEVLLGVYSPANKNINAKVLEPDLHKMIVAQKKFLGDLNTTKKYAVLCYLSTGDPDDASGFGALEHNTSTVAIFRKNMNVDELIHVISHEFFHTVTPLKVHSKEIQYFDFNEPKMSEHLWFYEGITEYFANLFQVNQGLIDEDKFYATIAEKVTNSYTRYSDSLSFTVMSKNILEPKMQAQYPNVYEKGALIAMCVDIIMRKNSDGKKGLRDLMLDLSKKFGADKPFDDDELIPVITSLTYPEVGAFLEDHVVKGIPIDYTKYLAIMGLEKTTVPVAEPIVFIHANKAYLGLDTTLHVIFAHLPDDDNNFYKSMGIHQNDIFLEVNNEPIDANNLNGLYMTGYDLEEDQPMTIKVKRDGEVMELKGNAKLNYVDGLGFRFTDQSKLAMKDAWLKN